MPIETQTTRSHQLEEFSKKEAAIVNPNADPRNIRRVIAEDPEWNLETVPPLIDLCVKHIVDNFEANPLLSQLLPPYDQRVLEKLPPTVSLDVTAPLIEDEDYWEKCCHNRWSLCMVSDHGESWKRMYFERHIQELIEQFTPDVSNLQELEKQLSLSGPYVKCLKLTQLLPSSSTQQPEEDEALDSLSDIDSKKPSQDHIDLAIPLKGLKNLRELQLAYRVKDCGMNFEWGLFNFTDEDCRKLAAAIKATKHLRILRIHHSKVEDKKARLLVSHLLDHPGLQTLDMSYNKLSDGTGRALGKLINGHSVLTVLNVSNNSIGSIGGISLGHALQTNTTLTHLNLKLNRLGDEGIQPVLKALMRNLTLISLDISSNDFGEPSASLMSEMLAANQTLQELSITCNQLGEAGGKLLQEGVEENKTLITLDLRLTEISAENEYTINQIIRTNANRPKI
ncbi:PREDICTED: T-complex-associated testis-expressed protein 1-like [Amphimedon queenslandica]|uniref:Dynein regulatory complex subunit 5 n=1 Tax=Amphimedon queenslandica TaxID=400682 RepID=A0A1X7VPT4_AMPQE|nr:PREDICTED: T-complex-associated testis-expressed protein 1-like [Amphimedon queenslandica]|eukprot:XP_003383294.1 PREDICTED: T-complex-associated testis-expressed protein 1-like [Amphimedon queenslandica]